jgi:hypothetical protein
LSNLTNTIPIEDGFGGTDLASNCLTASDAELINFLNIADPDWAETQTNCGSNNTAPICTAVTEISQIECEALVALYNSTDGPNWTDSPENNWNVTKTPCSSWEGIFCYAGHVAEIVKSENQLNGSIPQEIGNLTKLLFLFLDENQLSGSIPPEIGNLTQLEWLYLPENQLSGSIPPEIGNLTELIELDVSKNQLSGDIPSSLSNLTNTIPIGDGFGGIDLTVNCLTASDAELINFINVARPDWLSDRLDWAETQTACGSNNTAPILNPIGNKSIEQSKTLSFTATATDTDNNALIFALHGASENATINPNTGIFSWTPEQAGTFTLSVTVTETDGTPSNLSAEETITITITITVTEPPPPATCQNSATANEFNQTLPGVDGEFNNIWWGELSMEAFAVGNRGRIVHLEMLNLVEMNSGTNNDLFGIWGNSSNNLFAVGDNGTIIHYNGTNWTTQQSNSGEHLYGIWGNSATDVFATGLNGAIIHYDGSQWNVMQSNTSQDLFGIWGSSATNVFAIGSQGTIIHYDGNQWAKMISGTINDLFGIWGISSNDIYAVTKDYSTVVHYDGSEWAKMDSGFSTNIFRNQDLIISQTLGSVGAAT